VIATDVAGFALASSVYWLLVFVGTMALGWQVSTASWIVLYLVCAVAAPVMWRLAAAWTAGVWLYLAGCALVVAAGFYGANQGLDALHGAGRHKPDIASRLGGLELWFVLAPGAFAICIGGWLRKRLQRSVDPRSD
jgi:hypothetical protein